MALLRPKELRGMRPDDIKAKFKELSDELMHERGIAAMGGAPASPGKIRALRTNIARIHTIMRETEIAEAKKKATEKKPAAPAKKAVEKAKKEKPKGEKAAKARKEEKK
jgi:large subunit ribosomal protein L29